jgi:transcriptional regulator with PAS, ATPase and Fis domain
MQVKLLRVLESKEVERVGDHNPIPVDVRVITATNKDLDDLVEQGVFRADLFYRINVVPIHVAPLRERKEDIPLLAQSFIEKIARRSGRPIMGLTPEAIDLLTAYDWPGNVRELRNAIEYSFVLCHDEMIRAEHLAPRVVGKQGNCLPVPGESCGLPGEATSRVMGNSAKDELIRALERTGGNRTEAARILGISRVAVWKRMKRFGLL